MRFSAKKIDILDLAEQNELFENILDRNDFLLEKADDVLLSEKINDNEVDEIIEEVEEVKIKKDLKETIKNFYELKEYLLENSRPSEEIIKSLKTIENTLAVKHNGPISSILNYLIKRQTFFHKYILFFLKLATFFFKQKKRQVLENSLYYN
ncbi:hypothetical protein CDIK_0823 [Cucumispora dikerogammari]|nr:hypothetical protein CDIK_0823 [Cucumispora dikerogammari]